MVVSTQRFSTFGAHSCGRPFTSHRDGSRSTLQRQRSRAPGQFAATEACQNGCARRVRPRRSAVEMVAAVLLVGLFLASMRPASAHGETPGDASADQLQQLRSDIQYLSGEELRGRGVDDDVSIQKAAKYIAARMDQVGLDTELYDGLPFQQVPLTLDARAGSPNRNRLVVTFGEDPDRVSASLGDGLNPLAIGSLSGRVSGNLVFAGYGVTAPKLRYDDYAGIDARGAVVIVLRKEPGMADPDSPFNGTRNTRHAFFSTKVENAIKHGASAIIMVNDPESVTKSVERVTDQLSTEQETRQRTVEQMEALPEEAVNNRKSLSDRIAQSDSMIQSLEKDLESARQGVIGVGEAGQRPERKDAVPVISASRVLIDAVIQRALGKSLTEIEQEIGERYEPQSYAFGDIRAVLQVELTPSVADTSNVVGVISGKGQLADESVVVGAHYDHVGMGGYGSLAPGTIAVHNGADDNASGTAALLASAGRLVERFSDTASHRRIIYIAFTGEERGLIGSKFYVRNPRFPIESTVAMINMDMVGRLRDNELTIYGSGTAPVLDKILEEANQRQQFNLFRIATGYGPSDHQSFYEAGVPVMFFFTGLHNDYHRPTDDFDKINFGGLTRITDTVSEVTFQLATAKDRPKYTETEGLPKIRRQLTAWLGVTLSDRTGGVVLSSLAPGGPAEGAGLRIGDRVVKLAGHRIRKSSDILDHVRERAPEDRIDVQVIRNGSAIEFTVKLGSRPE